MKTLLTLCTLALTLTSQAQAQDLKLSGEWESDKIVMTIIDVGFVYTLKPILGDPGWKIGSLMLGDTNADGTTSFKCQLKTNDEKTKNVTGKVIKKGDKLTIDFDAESKLKNLQWTPGTGGAKGGTTLRVFCEAGYVARFKSSYDTPDGLGGYRQVNWTSSNLTAGRRETHTVPVGSRNVVVSGYMLSAGERHIKTMNVDFNKEYKVYGTIFSPQMVAQ